MRSWLGCPPDDLSYSYLLGTYLGDGNISMPKRTPDLRITLDGLYPGIVDEACTAVQLTAITARVTLRQLPSRGVLVACWWSGWLEGFLRRNLSEDILGLFCATCDRLGLRWTRSKNRNVSISHRNSTAMLDEHVGPKA